jgi:CheY-like chemotaxis protein
VLVAARRHGQRVRIGVWDTGPGIPHERRDDVFREFVQLEPTELRSGGGLGLGLAIVARLAGLLGTHIELRSRVGRGSMFAFELPLGAPRAPPVLPVAADLRGTFALVIDDDESARAGLCGLLQNWGCLTLAAVDGDDALAQLAAHERPPELIVSDYRLGDGADGLAAIARTRAAVGDVPAVLVTADTSAQTAGAAQAAGVPLLHKPVSPVKLRALLARLLAQGERVPD